MAKKSSIEKNNHRIKLVKQYASRRRHLKTIANNEALTMEERFAARLKLAELPRNSAAGRIRNRCALTGRPRGVYRKFGLGRNKLRDLALKGEVPGIIKASW